MNEQSQYLLSGTTIRFADDTPVTLIIKTIDLYEIEHVYDEKTRIFSNKPNIFISQKMASKMVSWGVLHEYDPGIYNTLWARGEK